MAIVTCDCRTDRPCEIHGPMIRGANTTMGPMTDNERTWEDDVMLNQAMGALKEIAPGLHETVIEWVTGYVCDATTKLAAERTKRESTELHALWNVVRGLSSDEAYMALRLIDARPETFDLVNRLLTAESRLAIAVRIIGDLANCSNACGPCRAKAREALAQIMGKE